MIKFLKKNKLIIIIFLILIFWLMFEMIRCSQEKPVSNDPLIMYYHLMKDLSLYFVPILAPLFVIIPSISQFHKELHSGTIKQILTRTEYKKYLRLKYISILKNMWILPLFAILVLFASCILTKSISFGSGSQLYGWIASPDIKYLQILPIFMITYIVVLILHSILYANIGLLCCKKNSNFLVTIILSYLSFLALDLIVEVLIGNLLLAKILNIHNITESLNLFSIWDYDNVINLSFMIIYSLVLAVGSTLIVYLQFKNKEGVIIEIEK